jgi:hypothetical protein
VVAGAALRPAQLVKMIEISIKILRNKGGGVFFMGIS